VKRRDGFTLLEVIVALAILSVAVVATIQGFAQGLRLLRLAGEHQRAALLADQKAREVVTLEERRDAGESDDNAFTWERTITLVQTPEIADQPSAADWRLYRIDVHVRWGSRDVEVATLRTTSAILEQAAANAGATPVPATPPSGTARPVTPTPAPTGIR